MQNCRGQSLVQFIIIMPVFFALIFGVFEMAYVYRAKATLNTATFEAARAGSLNHARLAPMQAALANGMIALYMQGDASVTGLGVAYGKAVFAQSAMSAVGGGLGVDTVTVVAPTQAVFDKFKKERMYQLNTSGAREELQYIMPNDNLSFRPTDTETFTIDGNDQEINIQDANLLKISTFWCYELKVPILKNLIFNIISGVDWLTPGKFGLNPSTIQNVCSLAAFVGDGRYIAMSSHAIVRMQSPVSASATLK